MLFIASIVVIYVLFLLVVKALKWLGGGLHILYQYSPAICVVAVICVYVGICVVFSVNIGAQPTSDLRTRIAEGL